MLGNWYSITLQWQASSIFRVQSSSSVSLAKVNVHVAFLMLQMINHAHWSTLVNSSCISLICSYHVFYPKRLL
jgi:hypothetical protein